MTSKPPHESVLNDADMRWLESTGWMKSTQDTVQVPPDVIRMLYNKVKQLKLDEDEFIQSVINELEKATVKVPPDVIRMLYDKVKQLKSERKKK